jgi:hypothetical protein
MNGFPRRPAAHPSTAGPLTALVATALLIVTNACAWAESPNDAHGAIRVDRAHLVNDAVKGLCDVDRLAKTDLSSARDAFVDRAHHPLHVMANTLEEADRSAAAELLEVKAKVETDFERKVSARIVRTDLDRLLRTAASALDLLGVPSPRCAPAQ